jgi:hypothetical protein
MIAATGNSMIASGFVTFTIVSSVENYTPARTVEMAKIVQVVDLKTLH